MLTGGETVASAVPARSLAGIRKTALAPKSLAQRSPFSSNAIHEGPKYAPTVAVSEVTVLSGASFDDAPSLDAS